MVDIKAVNQKVRGKVKQMEGSFNQKRGGAQGIKGGLQRMSGKLDEVMADAKLKRDQERQKRKNDW